MTSSFTRQIFKNPDFRSKVQGSRHKITNLITITANECIFDWSQFCEGSRSGNLLDLQGYINDFTSGRYLIYLFPVAPFGPSCVLCWARATNTASLLALARIPEDGHQMAPPLLNRNKQVNNTFRIHSDSDSVERVPHSIKSPNTGARRCKRRYEELRTSLCDMDA